MNATSPMWRKPQPYWLQELQGWILDPIETNDKTCIDFSGYRIGSLTMAICLCQWASATRNERYWCICWQEIGSVPQNSKANFPVNLRWVSCALRARMPVYFVWMHKANPPGSIQMSTSINVVQQNELLLPLSLFPSLVRSISVTTVFCPIRIWSCSFILRLRKSSL